MSAAEDRARGREWLEEQLAQLEKLRNANPRDPSFKMWRQNTLTVLQRIWPGEPQRSERFRRIPFSLANSKPAGGMVREHFARGCAETMSYLRSLIEEVELVGLPQAAPEAPPAPFIGESADGTIPILELPAGGGTAPDVSAPGYAMEENVLDLGAPKAPAGRPGHESPPQGIPRLPSMHRTPGTTPALEAAADAAPSLPRGYSPLDLGGQTREVAPAAPVAPAGPPLASAPSRPVEHAHPVTPLAPVPPAVPVARAAPPAPATPPAPESPAARRASRSARPRKAPPRNKLRSMLGLEHLESVHEIAESPAPVAPPAPAPAAAAPPRPPAPVAPPAPAPAAAAPPRPPAPIAPPAPAASAPPRPPAPIAPPAPFAPPAAAAPPRQPAPAVPSAPVAPPAPAPAARAPEPPPAKPAPTAPLAPPATPAAAAPVESELFDSATLSRATADFMRNSPVLGLQGRPVQRTSDVTQFLDPDAVAISSLAAELGRLGVPESAREGMGAVLQGVAVQVEAGRPEWERLRVAIAGAMDYPDLARRLVPILLPWLERAA